MTIDILPNVALLRVFDFYSNTYLVPRRKMETSRRQSFLSGPAPRLRTIYLDGISFPGLPKLLLSAIHLVIRSLQGILHPGYISSEAMAIGPALVNKSRKTPAGIPNRLNRAPTRNFDVHFHRHALSCPFSLTFTYMGIREYLEDLLARIDNLYSTT